MSIPLSELPQDTLDHLVDIFLPTGKLCDVVSEVTDVKEGYVKDSPSSYLGEGTLKTKAYNLTTDLSSSRAEYYYYYPIPGTNASGTTQANYGVLVLLLVDPEAQTSESLGYNLELNDAANPLKITNGTLHGGFDVKIIEKNIPNSALMSNNSTMNNGIILKFDKSAA